MNDGVSTRVDSAARNASHLGMAPDQTLQPHQATQEAVLPHAFGNGGRSSAPFLTCLGSTAPARPPLSDGTQFVSVGGLLDLLCSLGCCLQFAGCVPGPPAA